MKATLADARIEYKGGTEIGTGRGGWKKYAFYGLMGLTGLWMLVAGCGKLYGQADVTAMMTSLHYSVNFTRFIGLCEVLGGIAIFVRRTRVMGCLAMIGIMFGAIGSHFGAGQAMQEAMGATIALVMLLATFVFNSPRQVRNMVLNRN